LLPYLFENKAWKNKIIKKPPGYLPYA
jgi:hypothetical protein